MKNARKVKSYEIRIDGEHGGIIDATSAAEALEIAKDAVECQDNLSTEWVDVLVRCRETGEEAEETVTVEPTEPECEPGQKHDWQEPHAILGGLEENPGVWGHGGGVTIDSVCMRCGCGRTHDTWAQRPSNGVVMPGGSTSYEPGRYVDDLAATREASP